MKKTNKIAIGVIIIGILLLGIGYAAIQNITLYIKGTVTADPSQDNFKVRFTQVKSKSETTTSEVLAEIVDDLNAKIDVTGLTLVGETVFATYEIKNESGSLSADLAIKTTNNNEEYFEITPDLEKQSLVAGETTTVTVTVKLIKAPLLDSVSATVDVEITAAPVQPGEEGTTGGNEETEEPETFAQIVKSNPSTYYGVQTDYPIDIDNNASTNDWSVFYSNGENVFLIADDYVLSSKITNISDLGMDIGDGSYDVYWNSPKDTFTIDSNSNYLISRAGEFTTSNDNYKAVASLLATDEWTEFVDLNGNGNTADDFGISAIGSPTVEMWMASWNDIYGEQLYCNNGNANGYYVGTAPNPESTSINVSSLAGYDNPLYYPHQDGVDWAGNLYDENGGYYCYGYWLASMSAYDANNVIIVKSSGYIDSIERGGSMNGIIYGWSSMALRPVVCLNENVKATQDGDVWKLSSN